MNSSLPPNDKLAAGLHSLISAQAVQTPDRVAVVFGERAYTYRELDARACALAAQLVALGVGVGDRVVLCVERSADMVAALLGIMKSGAAYVPVDPSYPANRVQFMVQDSGASLILTQSSMPGDLFVGDVKRLDLDQSWPSEADPSFQPVASRPTDLIYVIYTSGSTGKPKGVQLTHGNVINFLLSMQKVPGLKQSDRLLAVTTLSFDIAVLELYLPLITGATVEVAPRTLTTDGGRFAERLAQGDISILQATPASWRMLLRAGWTGGRTLKALIGGEALPRDLVPELLANVAELWNMYGPTETAVWSTCFRVTDPAAPIRIGAPIDNTQVYVVNEELKPVAAGEDGELLIGGAGVSQGYLDRPELTAERFVADTLGNSGGKLYRTGDLVRLHEDGNLEYINRLDNQVKYNGHRIELGEIESVVAEHASVSQCVVLLRLVQGDARLVAYLVADAGAKPKIDELREFARQKLPEFMTPSTWVFVDAMPLTPNGKVDRKALPEPVHDRPELSQAFVPPRTPLEKYIAKMWREALGLDKIGTRDRFFELGGNSIKAIQFVDRIGRKIGTKISMPGFFGAPTIADFAQHLEREHGDAVKAKLLPQGAPRGPAAGNGASETGAQEGGSRHSSIGENVDLAIVGMACRLPGAGNVEQFWSNLQGGIESRYKVTAEDLTAAGMDPAVLNDPDYVPYCMPVDDVDKFDAAFFGINPREAQTMDPQHRLFLECAWTAMEDAGYAPQECKLTVGVFGGVARNAYQLHNLAADNEMRNAAGDYAFLLGNDKDFLATRVAYKLDLKGPAMTVQTACSASGAALHQARLSLLNGDCDMALVGGGRIMSPHKVGYHYVDGNVLSADGHVHAFDAQASGMIRGSGIAMILIKRLPDAIEDGDYIHAVIKSTAVNNDGSSKASFTAPTVPGQYEVIRRALDTAGLSPDSISYVEAHGTGTRLGDPIEVAGLSQAFSSPGRAPQSCPIGSSKTNVGHLDAGACVTGVIKTALSLQHRVIPPSLNFEAPNPLIDFANSPFYVNTKLSPWETQQLPRRAGVSSFGVGGTNVHVIVEEAPQRADSSESRSRQLLLISAKRNQAIGEAAARLCAWLKQHPDAKLADVAYTLQVGRTNLPLRQALVCTDTQDAIAKLEALQQDEATPSPAELGVPVVFMFPGQGSQHLDMARELYDQEPVFRVHVDHCARALKPIIDADLREIIYPPEGADREQLTAQLKRTEIAQLALFVVEYSLAKVWISWGVTPSSMIGHSVGEYVAAALAGVIELHDCLRVLAERARLMGSMPAGSMLAVALPLAEIETRLPGDISLAASNSPNITVISGPTPAIEAFKQKLEAEEIKTFPLHTSHAFHSAMMEPVLAPFARAFEGIALNPPSIPFISSMTGQWITDEQATSARYWGQQLRRPVLFSKGLLAIREEDNPLFIEVGPSAALSSAARQHIGADLRVITMLSPAQKPQPALETTLKALGQVWGAGVLPDWHSFYAAESRVRLSLPSYPFERVRHWIEPRADWASTQTASAPLAPRSPAEQPSATQSNEVVAQATASGNTVKTRLLRVLRDATGIEVKPSDEASTFLEIGFDSLLITQISAKIRKEFGIALQFRDLVEEYPNVKRLSQYLEQRVQPQAAATSTALATPPIATPARSGQEHTAAVGQNGQPSPAPVDSTLAQVVAEQSETIRRLLGLLERTQLSGTPTAQTLQDQARQAARPNWRADQPPVPGARLGRDPAGNPGWYVPDPERAGQYLRVGTHDQ